MLYVFQIWSMLTCHKELARGFEPIRNREISIIEWMMIMSAKLVCSPILVIVVHFRFHLATRLIDSFLWWYQRVSQLV